MDTATEMDTPTETETATFECSECGITFRSCWDDSEAVAEFEDLFGVPFDPSRVAVLCGECYEKMVSYDTPGH